LASLLAGVDVSGLSGFDTVEVLRAQYRQVNHERGRLLRIIAEVVLREDADGLGGGERPTEFAFDEVRAALVLTRRASDAVCSLAFDLVCRLPAVHAALAAGVLDEPKARVFSQWTLELADGHARAVCDALLPSAPGWTTGQLIEQVKRLAIALDPGWARRRYEQAVRGRRVVGSRNPDGSANFCGYDLPAEQVAAACARIDVLAKAAKRAGYPERLDFVRAELFLGMTDGRFTGLDDDAILAALLDGLPDDAADGAGTDGDAGDGAGTDGDAGHAAAHHADDADVADNADADTHGAGADGGSDANADARANGANGDVADGGAAADADAAAGDAAPPATAETDVAEADLAAGDRTGHPPDGTGHPPDAAGHTQEGKAGGLGSGRRSGRGIELQVRLTTLLGLDRKPAELAGWGPIHAELAQQIAAEHGGGHWRYLITNPAGQPIAVGPLRRRPAGVARTGRPGMVEIQVPEPTLRALTQAGGRPDGWHPVIAEILAGLNTHPAAGDPTARLPGAALRRWIRARDRTCIFPTCRMPARHTDADHTLEHAHGGPTIQTNLTGPCRHDHRLRHDGGWLLYQTQPGHVIWISRLGHHYQRRPPPAIPDLPDPITTTPDNDDQWWQQPLPDHPNWANHTCMAPDPPPPPTPAKPPTPPTQNAAPEDDIPPF
jgi:hypothetical protein